MPEGSRRSFIASLISFGLLCVCAGYLFYRYIVAAPELWDRGILSCVPTYLVLAALMNRGLDLLQYAWKPRLWRVLEWIVPFVVAIFLVGPMQRWADRREGQKWSRLFTPVASVFDLQRGSGGACPTDLVAALNRQLRAPGVPDWTRGAYLYLGPYQYAFAVRKSFNTFLVYTSTDHAWGRMSHPIDLKPHHVASSLPFRPRCSCRYGEYSHPSAGWLCDGESPGPARPAAAGAAGSRQPSHPDR